MKNYIKLLIFIVAITSGWSTHAQMQLHASLDFFPSAEEIIFFDGARGIYSGYSSSIGIKGKAKFPLGDYFQFGPYLRFIPSVSNMRFDTKHTIISLGASVGPRFSVEDHEFQVDAEIGFIGVTGSDDSGYSGLATNLNMAFVFNKDNDLSPMANIGFLSMPTGGDGDIGVSISPYWFFGGGVVFRGW